MVWWRTGNGVNYTKEGNMTFFEKLTDRQSMVFYILFCETNKQTNKFVNEENNLYQDIVGSHKATMLQFLHLSQVKNFQPLWFLWFLCPCHKVATRLFSKWMQILSWLLSCDCILMSKNQWRGPKQKSMEVMFRSPPLIFDKIM